MFCINCFHPTTKVTNSRPNKKQAAIWRRRHCPSCNLTFTTNERPIINENRKIRGQGGTASLFNPGRLILSIAAAFTHAPETGKEVAYWLARTVENELATQRETLSADDIAAITHKVLKKFDELAAIQYAAQHQLITFVRRRGRPSVS